MPASRSFSISRIRGRGRVGRFDRAAQTTQLGVQQRVQPGGRQVTDQPQQLARLTEIVGVDRPVDRNRPQIGKVVVDPAVLERQFDEAPAGRKQRRGLARGPRVHSAEGDVIGVVDRLETTGLAERGQLVHEPEIQRVVPGDGDDGRLELEDRGLARAPAVARATAGGRSAPATSSQRPVRTKRIAWFSAVCQHWAVLPVCSSSRIASSPAAKAAPRVAVDPERQLVDQRHGQFPRELVLASEVGGQVEQRVPDPGVSLRRRSQLQGVEGAGDLPGIAGVLGQAERAHPPGLRLVESRLVAEVVRDLPCEFRGGVGR